MTEAPSLPVESLQARVGRALFAVVDIRFLVFFRVYFAAMLLWTLWDFHANNLIARLYVHPTFHFTYHGISWVRPLPGNGMYVHFAILAVLSTFVLFGFLYRVSALLLAIGFTYVFLLEKAYYQNHYYLISMLCFLLVVLPANRLWSIDALLWPSIKSECVHGWTLWLLRFTIALPYVFGGVAKLKADWLMGQPMQMWMGISPWKVLFGPVVEHLWVALAFSWGGLFFDLAIVPCLLSPRTRPYAFAATVLFHLMNAFMFNVGIFPWLMIGATTVFFDPDWPGRIITEPKKPGQPPPEPKPAPTLAPPSPGWQKVIVGFLAVYVLVQVLLPLSHFLYPGDMLWTNEGYYFSWHMMIRQKVNALRFVLVDRHGQSTSLDLTQWLTPLQIESMGHDPEMMREFAEHVRLKLAAEGEDVAVHVVALCSLNGRKPQPIVDPRVDLSREPRRIGAQQYIVPLREPFRREPWDMPVDQWEKHLAEEGE